jgi:hypothetical protein
MFHIIIEDEGDRTEGNEEDDPDPEHELFSQFEILACPHLFRPCANKI